jgi:hypothetical protein
MLAALEQALVRQLLDRLADGRAADGEPLRQALLGERGALGDLAGEQVGPQAIGDLLAKARREDDGR